MQQEYLMDISKYTEQVINTMKKKQSEIIFFVLKKDKETKGFLYNQRFKNMGSRFYQDQIVEVWKWDKNNDTQYEEMSQFFDRRVHDYDVHMNSFDNYKRSLVELTSNIAATYDEINILDLGCGTGAELRYIFKQVPNAHVDCIDMADKMLKKLWSDYRDFRRNITIHFTSFFDMDFGVNKYDYVISCNTLHHYVKKDKLKLYIKIRNSLKNNGIMLIDDYTATSEEQEMQLLERYHKAYNSGETEQGTIYHIDIPLTRDSEESLINEAGFSTLDIKTIEGKGIHIIARK
ncbi:MAG: class I SAM-dependent methyltransferase [Clostridiales bacterium]|nr:class I SAM-dependent methyltransferase [Clostridiales bacterium]